MTVIPDGRRTIVAAGGGGGGGPISSVTGTRSHDATLTINAGTGNFGTKSPAAPTVWDNCMHGQALTARWGGGWPTDAAHTPNYRPVQRSQPMPHARTTNYLCMCNFQDGGANNGWNAMTWKAFTLSRPHTVFWSFRHRCDSSFNSGDNWKYMDYSTGTEPYNLPNNWYIEKSGGLPAAGPTDVNINDDNSSLDTHGDGANFFGDWYGYDGLGTNKAVSPKGTWVQQELLYILTDTNAGAIRQWDNGVLCLDYSPTNPKYGAEPHPTDTMAGTSREVSIGGYTRLYSTNNWRYYTDIYLDIGTQARVVIGNASTYAATTVREMQIPSAWSTTQITVTCNQGALSAVAGNWLYVITSTGSVVNSTGFQL